MNTAGAAVFQLYRVNFRVETKLLDWKLITPSDSDASDQDRIASVISRYLELYSSHNCTAAIIELPPDTIYGWKVMSKQGIVARAQSVFKVYAVAAGLHAAMRAEQCQMVLPQQWQPCKKERLGMDIKDWSLWNANTTIMQLGHSDNALSTKADENIADAISMGTRLLPYLLAGKLPE